MSLIITSLEKRFNNQTVFKDLNISFPDTGLICILGKSGCGKSTLLHCIAILEKPDKGEILLGYEKITSFKEKRRIKYLNQDISMVFQHYQLIEDQSLVFNAALPLLIKGERKEYAYKKAEDLLKEVGFDNEKQTKLVNSCSGGEKQRVALIRSVINEPKIILADEPTGALDSQNSKVVMDLLKKFSMKHLVIMVTHNKSLIKPYADRILTMANSRFEVEIKNEIKPKEIYETKDNNKLNNEYWKNHFVESNLRKRIKRNTISSISLGVSLVFSFILFGFIHGSDTEIKRQSIRQYDVGVSTISIEKKTEIEKSKLKLVQDTRLSPQEIEQFISQNDFLEYGLNYDYLIPLAPSITLEGTNLTAFTFNPIYSFVGSYCPNYLKYGRLAKDNLNEVVINDKAYKDLSKKLGKSPLDCTIKVESQREITTYLDKENTPYIIDYFEFKHSFKIVGVVDELPFLNTPKIYYSFKALDKYMSEYLMNNLSKEYEKDYSFKDRIDQCSPSDPIGSYSYRLFIKDINKINDFERMEKGDYQITNNSFNVREAITSFILAATMGMELFLGIAILGSVFILGITSFSSYTQDQHTNAILLSLGAKRDDIFLIYIFESLFIGMFSFFISLAASLGLSLLINKILYLTTGFSILIQIPLKEFMGRKFLIPIIVFLATSLISYLASYIPMVCSKKTSLSQELKEE